MSVLVNILYIAAGGLIATAVAVICAVHGIRLQRALGGGDISGEQEGTGT